MQTDYHNKAQHSGTCGVCSTGDGLGFRCFLVPDHWNREMVEAEATKKWGEGRLVETKPTTWEWKKPNEGAD